MIFKRSLLLAVLALLNAIFFARMVWGPTGLVSYREIQRQQAELEREIAELDEENRVLSREIRLLQTNSQYVENIIRQRLHHVYENEVLYLFDETTKPQRDRNP